MLLLDHIYLKMANYFTRRKRKIRIITIITAIC